MHVIEGIPAYVADEGLTPIQDVQVGDTIMDGKNRIKVVKIEHGVCSTYGTHVNDSDCWGRHTSVRLTRDSPTMDRSNTALGDLLEDYDRDPNWLAKMLLPKAIYGPKTYTHKITGQQVTLDPNEL